jgi:hypothetical protein
MSKYSNNENTDFSKSKYFVQPNISSSTIQKNLSHNVADIQKYVSSISPISQPQSLKKSSRYKKISNDDARQEKYFSHDNTIIQKRATTIQKNWFKDLVERAKKYVNSGKMSAEELARFNDYDTAYRAQRLGGTSSVDAQRLGGTSSVDASTLPEPPQIPGSGLNPVDLARASEQKILPEGMARLIFAVDPAVPRATSEPKGVLGTRATLMWERQNLTPAQRDAVDVWNRSMRDQYGEQNFSIFPYQSVDTLSISNPAAHAALLSERKARGRNMEGKITEKEATSLSARYGSVRYTGMEPGDPSGVTFRSPTTTNPEDDLSEVIFGSNVQPKKTKSSKKPALNVTANESTMPEIAISPAEQQWLDDINTWGYESPVTHKSYIKAKFPKAKREEVAVWLDKLSDGDVRDEAFGDFALTLSEKQASIKERQKAVSNRMLSMEPVEEIKPDSSVASVLPDKDVKSESTFASNEPGTAIMLHPRYTKTKPGDFNPARSSSADRLNLSTNPINVGKTRNERMLEGLITSFPIRYPKPKNPFQMPKLTTKQKIIGGALLAAGVTAGVNEYMKPRTVIPDSVQATGKNVMYGKPSRQITPGSKVAKIPGLPSNDFLRPLMTGIAGSGGTKQMDEFGNYVYVRSPRPFAPNESKFDALGNRKGLTTRGKEEMWRFGSDLYDSERSKDLNTGMWWSGKETFNPDDTKIKP